jgi:16S rRNA (uracil1498-N3)-methyltransferase
MSDDLYKFPRLYVPDALVAGAALPLSETHAHYLKTVLRREAGAQIRLFNGVDGEWLGTLETSGKKGFLAKLEKQVKPQPARLRRIHLLFPPLKKDRLDILIEKAVELNATDLYPVLTQRTEVREIKQDRIKAQMIEAAEQCERLDIPTLHPVQKLEKLIAGWNGGKIFAALERSDAKILNDNMVPLTDCAALIGPAGGWTDDERELLLNSPNVTAISLGDNILRAETAAIVMLVHIS